MNRTNTTVGSVKGCSTLERARFGPGMLLQHEDLEQVNAYTRDLSRLLFRSFFGCGVVCGLAVETRTNPKCGNTVVTVGAGVALACSGDPVYVPHDQTIELDGDADAGGNRLWVVLCRTVKGRARRTAVCASDDDDELPSMCTR